MKRSAAEKAVSEKIQSLYADRLGVSTETIEVYVDGAYAFARCKTNGEITHQIGGSSGATRLSCLRKLRDNLESIGLKTETQGKSKLKKLTSKEEVLRKQIEALYAELYNLRPGVLASVHQTNTNCARVEAIPGESHLFPVQAWGTNYFGALENLRTVLTNAMVSKIVRLQECLDKNGDELPEIIE